MAKITMAFFPLTSTGLKYTTLQQVSLAQTLSVCGSPFPTVFSSTTVIFHSLKASRQSPILCTCVQRIYYKPMTYSNRISSRYCGICLMKAHLSGPVEASIVLVISELFFVEILKFSTLLSFSLLLLTWVLLQGDTCLVCLCKHAF